ncbi:MAG: M20/M25/M40 family metallo-hydrolase [Thermoprotei archaeon]|jgi:acetylornithine deacetylase/succinyl-diaminopimelate desuccinylase-like protein
MSEVLERIFKEIDARYEVHLKRLQRLVRQPSVSPLNIGVRDCAELVKEYFIEIGCSDAHIVETSGNPVVYGEYNVGAERTVLVYMMYDTMPADEEDWIVPPFEGRIVSMSPFGDTLVARGAENTKGPLVGFLNAVETIKDVAKKLPVNLIFVAEGEEELGSRHLPEFIGKYIDRLKKADVLFFPAASENRKGKPIIHLGVKGIVYFEVELSGEKWGKGPIKFGIHGSNKAWVDSPVWRFIHGLSTMTTIDGNKVLIDGFYDKISVPTKDDEFLLKQLAESFDEDAVKEELGIKQFIDNKHGVDALRLYLFSPTLNIDGIWGGYTQVGTKTLLPHKVTAKMDVRLVPNMTIDDVIPMIRKHFEKHGFPEIEVRVLERGYNPAKMSYRNKYVQALLRTIEQFNKKPEIWPTIAGSAPFSLFHDPPLNLPFIMGGLGHGGLAHSPNEYLVVGEGGPTGGLRSMEKSFVLLLYNISRVEEES